VFLEGIVFLQAKYKNNHESNMAVWKIIASSFSIKSLVRIAIYTHLILLFLLYSFPVKAELHMNAKWDYSKNSSDVGSGTVNQSYSTSVSHKAALTDLIDVGGALRYSKHYTEYNDRDLFSSSLNLNNENDLYYFGLLGTYSSINSDNSDNYSWNWGSRLDSRWTERIWPTLSFNYFEKGGSGDSLTQDAGFRTNWRYFNWLSTNYSASWYKRSETGFSEDETLQQNADLRVSESFWDDRASFTLGQSYQLIEVDRSNRVTETGFAFIPVNVSQAWSEETADPLPQPPTNSLTNPAHYLLTDADVPPTILTIDPANPLPLMKLILFTGSRDVDVLDLYTANDISSFFPNVKWQVYQSLTGIDNWTLIPDITGYTVDYDLDEQRIRIDFATSVNNEYILLVIDPTSLSIPLGEVIDLEAIEVFRKEFGPIGSIITESTEDTIKTSRFGMRVRPFDTVQVSYNVTYTQREENNRNERKNLSNNASLSWSPSNYFRTRFSVTDSRQDIEDKEESISRSYNLSVSSQPLEALLVNSGISRSEHYIDSTLTRATNTYTIQTAAELYRDLQANFRLSYNNPQEGGGSDSIWSNLSMTARLTPTFLLYWTTSYNQNLDTNTYFADSRFTVNWRISQVMYMNVVQETRFGSDEDTKAGFGVNMGVSPNWKNRITLGYTIDDFFIEETRQVVSGKWFWIISRVFNSTVTGLYQFAEEDSWSIHLTLTARLSSAL
jgi:hypothetical protein